MISSASVSSAPRNTDSHALSNRPSSRKSKNTEEDHFQGDLAQASSAHSVSSAHTREPKQVSSSKKDSTSDRSETRVKSRESQKSEQKSDLKSDQKSDLKSETKGETKNEIDGSEITAKSEKVESEGEGFLDSKSPSLKAPLSKSPGPVLSSNKSSAPLLGSNSLDPSLLLGMEEGDLSLLGDLPPSLLRQSLSDHLANSPAQSILGNSRGEMQSDPSLALRSGLAQANGDFSPDSADGIFSDIQEMSSSSKGLELNPRKKEMSGADYLSMLNDLKAATPRSGGAGGKEFQSGGEEQKQSGSQFSSLISGLEKGTTSKKGKLGEESQIDELVGKKMDLTHSASHLNPFQGALNSASLSNPSSEVSANVVPGAMSRERISTDGLNGISAGVQKLSVQGGGEMRVRLRPDNLGELNIRVLSEGNRISVQIQASNEKSKAVIEESLSHLKEGLQAQNVTLNQIEITLASAAQNSNSDGSGNPRHSGSSDFSSFSGFQDTLGQTGNQNRQSGQFASESGGRDAVESGVRSRRSSGGSGLGLLPGIAGAAGGRYSDGISGGRLDVRA